MSVIVISIKTSSPIAELLLGLTKVIVGAVLSTIMFLAAAVLLNPTPSSHLTVHWWFPSITLVQSTFVFVNVPLFAVKFSILIESTIKFQSNVVAILSAVLNDNNVLILM